MLVCADGISSSARAKLLPEAKARYAGYVAWRAVIPESDLTPASFEALRDSLTYCLLPSGHVLVYPIPSLEGALEPGRRLANLVCYHNYEEGDALEGLMTDRSGERQPLSLPPGMVRTEHTAWVKAFAGEHMAPAIAEILHKCEEPFVQVIYDIDVARMAFGPHRPHRRPPPSRCARTRAPAPRRRVRGCVDVARRPPRRGAAIPAAALGALGAGPARPRPAAPRTYPRHGGSVPVPPDLGPRRPVATPRPVRAGAVDRRGIRPNDRPASRASPPIAVRAVVVHISASWRSPASTLRAVQCRCRRGLRRGAVRASGGPGGPTPIHHEPLAAGRRDRRYPMSSSQNARNGCVARAAQPLRRQPHSPPR